MTTPRRPIEIPPPGVPGTPEHEPSPVPRIPRVPLSERPTHDDPIAGLLASRRLLLIGRLEDETVERVSAELMLLDGRSMDPVELSINSAGGPVEPALALLDVLTLMRAPVATRCIGMASGTAAAVLASGTGDRSATPRATICLRISETTTVEGRADDIRRDAERLSAAWHQLATRVVETSRLTLEQAVHDIRDGDHLSADDARDIGLIDHIVT